MKMPWEDDDDGGGFGGSVVGKAVGTAAGAMIPGAAIPGAIAGSQLGGVQKQMSKAFGYDNSKQKDLMDQADAVSAEEANRTRERVGWMEDNDRKYQGQLAGYGKDYLADLDKVKNDMQTQVKDARAVYSNDIQPRMKNIMEDAQQQAGQAMSLKDAGDVNNSVQRGVRGLYDQYAQGIQNQSMADFGVMSALGAQATQNTMGAAGPMTGAQMQLINAGNQANAGIAYQNAQKRIQGLKEQGIARGFDESSKQYDRGVGARDRYANSVGNYEAMMDRNNQREQGYRDQELGMDSDRFGVQRGLARENLDIEQGIRNRDLAQIGMEYGNRQGMIANQINAADAENAGKRGILGGLITAGATGAGAYFGGAKGAQAGAMAGGGVANGMQAGNQSYYQIPRQQAYMN